MGSPWSPLPWTFPTLHLRTLPQSTKLFLPTRCYQSAMFLRPYCEIGVGVSISLYPRSGLHTSHRHQRPGGGAGTRGSSDAPLPATVSFVLSPSQSGWWGGKRVWTAEGQAPGRSPPLGRWTFQQQLGWLDLDLEVPMSHYGHMGSLLTPEE